MNSSDGTMNDIQDPDASRGSRGFLAVLWQRKALVVLGITLGLIGGSLFYWQRPPIYQASAQLLIIKKNNVMPIGPVQQDMGVVEDYMATQVFLLRSPAIIERAIKKKELLTLKTFENSGDPVGQILGSLTVTRDSKETPGGANNILHLTVRGPVPDDCGKVILAVIESYQEFLDITYRNVSDKTLELITNARDMLKKDLTESEKNFLDFRAKHGTTYLRNKDGLNVYAERIASLVNRSSTLSIRQTELRETIRFLSEAIANDKGQEVLGALRSAGDGKNTFDKGRDDTLLALLIEEKRLLETFGEDHPMVQSVRGRTALVREYFEKSGTAGTPQVGTNAVQRHLQILQDELRITDKIIDSLSKDLESVKAETKDQGNQEIQEDHLRNDIVRTQQLYESTIKRLKEIGLVRDTQGVEARPLSQSANGVKVAPSAFQTIIGGLLLGLLAGIGLAFLADLTDKSFRNPDEVRTRLGLPVLGHIPFLVPDAEAAQRAKAGETTLDPLLLALFRPKSLDAEVYRAVRTALYFSVQGEGHRVLQVTSPNKGDGKSLVISNLAISMAQSGKKVLMIDADCRRPRQHKIFNLSNTRGLVTILAEQTPWREIAQATPVEGLWVIPSGPVPANPSELLSSPRFANLLETTRPEFDYVLVDTPPLLAVTDPCVVADKVDGLILVLRLTRHGRPHAERAREILSSLGVNILGVIVNGISRQGGGGIYSSEHYDYTESYEEADESGEDDGYYYDDDKPSPAAAQK